MSKGTTPWDDLHNKAGYVCSLQSLHEFVLAVENIASMNSNTFLKASNQAIEYYVTKLKNDSAVQGHKNMFNTIINSTNEVNN